MVPCFNEFERWDHDYWNSILKIPNTFFIFIDDGSTDDTFQIISKIENSYTNVKVIRKNRNSGKAEAVRTGFEYCIRSVSSIALLGFMDSDGSVDRLSIEQLMQIALLQSEQNSEAMDAYWGSRIKLSGRNIRRSTARHFLGRILAFLFSFPNHSYPYDTQCGLKLFKYNSDFKNVIAQAFDTRWLFELEIIERWPSQNGRQISIWEEPLTSWKEIGASKITTREIFRIMSELVTIKRLQFNSSRAQRH